ncbi:MAG: hypothetical protein WBR33_21755, partial [Pseudonocardiaceae bacterium]
QSMTRPSRLLRVPTHLEVDHAVAASVITTRRPRSHTAAAVLAPTQFPERRLANGQLLNSLRRTGNGQIRIDNGTEHDAVVKLVQAGKSIVSVYVSKGSNTTVDNINDGGYELFYTSGIDWDDQFKTFTRSCLFKHFETPVEFTTVPIQGGIKYTTQVVRLVSRAGENAPTTVPARSFPR